MKQIKSLMVLAAILLTLVTITIVPSASHAQTIQPPNNSAESSKILVTPADDGFRRACAEAVEELRSARKLIAAQSYESRLLVEMIQIEREISTGLKNLRSLDASQVEQLKKALAAKDRVIAAHEAEIAVLKKSRWTFWKKAKAVAIGAAAGIVIGAIVVKR